MDNYFTKETNFYGNSSPAELVKKYGSPLYIYNETILRQRCRDMISFVSYPNFTVNYSSKANTNLELLKIIHEEGLHADAISPGEIHVLLAAGYKAEEIFYISNNVSKEEMLYAIERNILMSIDSLSQLKQFGSINPGGRLAVRLNPGLGVGHHEKVITAGENTKFGINLEFIPEIKRIAKDHNLQIVGINQHLGSLFMDGKVFIEGAKLLLSAAKEFDDLEFIDIGGGFGIPYNKQNNEPRLELKEFGKELSMVLETWTNEYGKKVFFKIEPGRYITAECGVIIGNVHSIKENHKTNYIGTDLGFNVLARPMLYGSHHDIEIYKKHPNNDNTTLKRVTMVGNICESGDIFAQDRMLPTLEEGDVFAVMDAGAYGYSMTSNYNNRLRPAEVLIESNGDDRIIRRRDTFDDLMRNFIIQTQP